MAKGKKSGGKNFTKGNKGGPGRPQLPSDIKGVRQLNNIELERILNDLILKPLDEVNKIAKDMTVPAINALVAKIISLAHSGGDAARAEFILNRLIGKVKDKTEHSGKVTLEDLVAGSNEPETTKEK